MSDFSKLAINQFTTLHQWSLPQAIEGYTRHGVHAIGIVRDKLQEVGVTAARRSLRDHEMTVTCLLHRRPLDRLRPRPVPSQPGGDKAGHRRGR